jgi:XTP/dITP diphosphohydrolase
MYTLDELEPETTVVVATGNAHKVTEIEAILAPVLPGVRFVALGEIDLPGWEEPEENGATFVENALIKAEAAAAATGITAIADDSGLMVAALDGAPGVMSARYAGVHGDDAANNAKLVAALAQVGAVTQEERQAHFHSCVALVEPEGPATVAEGDCWGSIGEAPRGNGGFGYDPLFLPEEAPGRTMAELIPEEKNAISHRYHALTRLAAMLAGE